MVHSDLPTSLKSKFNGERAFILGNGPSLEQTPLDKLESEYTFAVNKINKIYDQTSWRPSFFFTGTPPSSSLFASVDSNENPITYHIQNDYTCFLPHTAYKYYGERKNIHYYTKFWLLEETSSFHQMTIEEVENLSKSHLLEYWSQNASNLLYLYHSLYGLTQLVMWMGFDEIYFLGTDLGLEYRDPHMIFENALDPHRFDGNKKEYFVEAYNSGQFLPSILNGIAMKCIENEYLSDILDRFVSISDGSHFDTSYLSDLRIWDGPQFDKELIKSHTAIRQISEYLDVNVYNATVGGQLEVYPRVDIKEVL